MAAWCSGLDGFAGHVQRAAGADDPGYLGMLAWPREVAAVTGACLAVEARKFFEIGGFDEVRLPVEYNDIDLCLRLAERGYRSVFEPRARLMHRESATRGANPLSRLRATPTSTAISASVGRGGCATIPISIPPCRWTRWRSPWGDAMSLEPAKRRGAHRGGLRGTAVARPLPAPRSRRVGWPTIPTRCAPP